MPAAHAAGLEAAEKLARAERLRAEAVAQLVDVDLIDGHIAEGYATPERHLIDQGNVAAREAARLRRVVVFCTHHTLVAGALEAGEITIDHADVLRTACQAVGAKAFDDEVLDLLAAARNVELADLANQDHCCDAGIENGGQPSGVRAFGGRCVDVVLDLPTSIGADVDLDDHRIADGQVDWDSIRQELTAWGPAPKRVLDQFLCDASWRQLITSGRRVVLDHNTATPDISAALRRLVQRRDRCCQFAGCDRVWQWCDVHHLVPRERGGPTNEQNLALVCRFHHTLIHQGGWRLTRQPDGRSLTTRAPRQRALVDRDDRSMCSHDPNRPRSGLTRVHAPHHLVPIGAQKADSTVVDLGAGTGQLGVGRRPRWARIARSAGWSFQHPVRQSRPVEQ